MKKLLIIVALLASGCSTTVPVERKFPDVPIELKQACPALKLTDPDTDKLSVVVNVVKDNYMTYHECRIKLDGWIEWYDSQKRIFEAVK